jgi:DNA-binding transcriptional LysR family regulator
VVELVLKGASAPVHFERVYETDMAEGLKAMAVEGHGIAFLPTSAVKEELRTGRLVSAVPPELKDLQLTMEIRVYRERPADIKLDAKGGAVPKKRQHESSSNAAALWDYLLKTNHQN